VIGKVPFESLAKTKILATPKMWAMYCKMQLVATGNSIDGIE
jgi:hypothetical protein